MAERTFAEIEAGGKGPSMVAGTEEEAFVRFISTHGPYKVETLYFQQDASNDFAAEDTFKSRLAHPLFCTVVTATDIDGTALDVSADLTSDESNANFKQITVRDAEDINGMGLVLQIFGF